MSNDPPSISLPSSRGGNTLGSNKLVSPQLTQQQLREQRLARFGGEGGGDNDNVNNSLQSQAQAQPHSIKLLPTNSPSHLPMTTTMTTNASANNEKQKLANNDNAATSEIIKQDPEEEKEEKEKELSTGNAFGRSASSTADLNEDEGLQAALALSLGLPMDVEDDDQNNDVIMSNDEPNNPASAIASADGGKIIRNDPQYFSGRVRTWYETASPCNNLAFHHCMWDAGVTTGNDKKRWISQGIRFKEEYDDNKSARTSSLLTAIISSPAVWSLTQQHGGPCGVLAAIQAEFLRILLFGPRMVHPLSFLSIDIPTHLTNQFTTAPPDMSRQKMRQTLALSMGIILARCSLMSEANLDDNNTTTENNDNQTAFLPCPEPIVRLVLPKHELWDTTTCLEWQHLEPWDRHDEVEGPSNNLFTYTISVNYNTSTTGETALKRQKRSVQDGYESGSDNDLDHLCTELAHATAQFLLETNSLNWFQRPGGVLLMVMSMVFSRGIPKMKSDMDDQTAKLTSNFGHCSQELINLLLTGQAVSNVFDYTLRPSGELICRGIQSRPAIGYMTQLEAMRYLEVGAFYKTPRFPIWVIGSTSHFTVMFSDAAALKESASDILLERVRRAFKRMDGAAAENGFIQTIQLGDFLQKVGLQNIPEQGVQTLAALIEVNGAGIILWEDLWKRTSRLLTGASLESILDTDKEIPSLSNSSTIVSANPALETRNIDAPLTDEELARKLQAEWNGETVDLTGTSPLPTPKTTSPTITNAETFGPTFQLFHYNGLRGGTFKPFRVTRLCADEAIGASVSLGGSDQASHSGGGLQEILRTKWPACKINWITGSSPSID